MKNIFTFLLCSLISLASFAYNNQTVTILFKGVGNGNGNSINRNIEVVIDGRSYYPNNTYGNKGNNRNRDNERWSDNGNVITFSNLQPGQHSIIINKGNNNRRGGSVYSNSRGDYSSNFTIKQGYDLTIEIKGNGEVAYIERPSYKTDRRQDTRDKDWRNDRNDDRGYGRDDGWRNNTGDYDRRNDNGSYNNRIPAMSDASFNQLLQSVRAKWLQSGKVSAVRDAFNNSSNYFSTYQVKQLLEVITSEANRVELAKTSYRNVVDKSYFSLVYDLFTSKASKDELERYTRSYRI